MTRIVDYRKLLTTLDQRIVPDGINPYYPYKSNAKIEYNTTDYWDNIENFIPEAGTIIIYSDYKTVNLDGEEVDVPGIKIGSGNAYVQDLAFIDDADMKLFLDHIKDFTVHVTPQEKASWNRRLNVDDTNEVANETLIFIRN